MEEIVQCEALAASGQSETGAVTEAEAIRRAQQGDAKAFEHLYRSHSNRVYALCLRMLKGNTTEAEDLTQEVFLHLFRKIHTFRAESAFSTWLHRMAFNIVLMRLRKQRKTVAESSLDETRDADGRGSGVRIKNGAPNRRQSRLVDRLNLQWAVDQLSTGYRSIFVLHDVLGYEHKQIADIWGCSIGNSKSQLHKGRALLRQLLLKGRARNDKKRKGVAPASYRRRAALGFRF